MPLLQRLALRVFADKYLARVERDHGDDFDHQSAMHHLNHDAAERGLQWVSFSVLFYVFYISYGPCSLSEVVGYITIVLIYTVKYWASAHSKNGD